MYTSGSTAPRGILYVVLLVIALSGCKVSISDETLPPATQEPEFIFSGLDGKTIYTFYQIDNAILAGTDKGLYRLGSSEQWQLLTPTDWEINSITHLASDHLLMSVSTASQNYLAESVDNGQNWQWLEHDFGGSERDTLDQQERIRDLVYHPQQNKLYAVGFDVLAVSEDQGRHWQLLAGQWNGFASGLSVLKIHPDYQDIWYGGQGAIENLVLRRFTPSNMFLEQFYAPSELLPNPSTAKGIVFHLTDQDTVFVSGEGGIIKTLDYGETWQQVLLNEDSRFYFDLILDQLNRGRIFTAGWDKNFDDPQSLILQVSLDGGQHWQSYTHPDNKLFGGVWSMTSRIEQGHTVLYLGLYKGGVMKVKLPNG